MPSRSDVMAAMSSSSVGKPSMDSSSAAKPAKVYAEMVSVSEKKTDEVKDLKRQRNQARLAVKRGRRSDESQALIDNETEAASRYGSRKQKGVAAFLGPRMGD